MDDLEELKAFYKGRTILLTGHTGFKGSWLAKMLLMFGAKVIGYALEPPTEPNLFTLLGLSSGVESVIGDVRDYEKLLSVFRKYRPEIVFHLAAQPIVRESYKCPRYTYDTNVIGTVNVLECIRNTDCVRSFVNITTDKVYENRELKSHLFKEDEKLDGYDPYSNSKSCSELVSHSYFRSFLQARGVAASTVRAGNVIGGGDFAVDRIIPDCVRAVETDQTLNIRNPEATRPYQHVLEPLRCYLWLAMRQFSDLSLSGAYNCGPDREDCVSTRELVELFARNFGAGFRYEIQKHPSGPHEAEFLVLDNGKIRKILGLAPKMHIDEAVRWTADWTKEYLKGGDLSGMIEKQITAYLSMEQRTS